MSTTRLSQLIHRKHEVLSLLLRLGARQIELVHENDWDALAKVLSAKGKLLAAITQIEAQLAPFQEQSPDARIWDDPGQRDACRQQAAECNTMLAEIMRLERDSEAHMVRSRDRTAQQLAGLHDAGAARHAYLMDDGAASLGLDMVSSD
jgi:hypothetical protein